jgi:hypothetical protein
MHLTHQYNPAYFSGLVKNRCTYHTHRFFTKPEKKAALYWCDRRIDSLPSQKSKRRCIGVLGASILYQAKKVSGVVLVC